MRGERAIRRRWAFADAIIQSIHEGICALDPDGRFTFINGVAEQLLGRSEAELLGRHLHEILPLADASDYPSRLLDVVRSGEVATVEEVFRRPDGSLLAVSVNSAPIVLAGGERGAVVVFRDLTGQRDAEQRLVAARSQAEGLAALERTKSEFLKLASHELRGPLAVLGGYLSMLEDGSVQDANEVLNILHSKVREMELLVDKMLETARLEEGRLDLHLEGVELRTVVAEAVDAMRRLAGPQHPIQVHLGRRAVPVLADRGRLHIILNSLLDNAVKFSGEGARVDCSIESSASWAAVAIRDRGLGIAPEDLPQLFTRFGRPVTKENSHIPGSGLGLYLARELARIHGGDIRVTSQVGRGSTFTLVLPIQRARRTSRSLLPRPKPAGKAALRPTLAQRLRLA